MAQSFMCELSLSKLQLFDRMCINLSPDTHYANEYSH